MEPLWAPWRMDFILGRIPRDPGCVLCALAVAHEDEQSLVLGGDRWCYVVLNRYPYTSGHLMVVPREHGADFGAMSVEVATSGVLVLQAAERALRSVLGPHGVNLGMNLGEVAGAGIPGHLHWHAVPRWTGDTNFMPVLADRSVIPEHLRETWRRLRPAVLEEIRRGGGEVQDGIARR